MLFTPAFTKSTLPHLPFLPLQYQYVTALSMELHIESRGDLRPDPEFDPIKVIFYSVFDDVPEDKGKRNITGMILVDPGGWGDSDSVYTLLKTKLREWCRVVVFVPPTSRTRVQSWADAR